MSALPELPPARGMVLMCGAMTYVYPEDQMREYGDARAAHARKQALEEAESAERDMYILGGTSDEAADAIKKLGGEK